jgi:formimidoylglutamate deiminase
VDQFGVLLDGCRRAASCLPDAVGIAPHSLRAVTPTELATILPLARHGPVHLHAAETTREVDVCRDSLGARPVEWLLDNVELDERWCIVRATHMTDDETKRLARSGAVVGLCPITEANLGDGVFPAHTFREREVSMANCDSAAVGG